MSPHATRPLETLALDTPVPRRRLYFRRAGRFFAWIRAQTERARQRRALARLDDRLLADVGLTRAQVEAETWRLSFWR